MARVVMVSPQRPRNPMNVMVMTVKMASPLPEKRQAAMAISAITRSGGRAFRPASSPFRVCSTGHLMA